VSAPAEPTLAAAFAERAASVGTEVHAGSRTDSCALIERLLSTGRAHQVALDAEVSARRAELVVWLGRADFEVVASDADAHTLAQVDAGISWAAFGVAETGSVALAAPTVRDRLVSMLPPLHLVLLPQSALLPDLDAAAGRLRAWVLDRVQQPYVSLVTGASRTSDIERVLTIGVHGPREQHVILLSDE
jgi:L-lactate dehydrogenase complex protein LldG